MVAAVIALAGATAHAEEVDGGVVDLGRLRLDDGRKAFPPPVSGMLLVTLHGELQLRAERDSLLPLSPPPSDPSLTGLGQRTWGTSWLRIGGEASYSDRARLVVQIEAMPRWIVGDLAAGVGAAGDSARDASATSFAQLRRALLEYQTPLGLFRIGQQGFHWGLGLAFNDGEHPRRFGDYRSGSILERFSLSIRPGGAESPWSATVTGDLVYRDQQARFVEGDRAYQATASVSYERGETFVGVYGVRRWQTLARTPESQGPGADAMRLWVIDATARSAFGLGETGNVLAFAAAEVVTVVGDTSAVGPVFGLEERQMRSFGGAVQVGLVRRSTRRGRSFGQVALEFEAGHASGDADPYDETLRRFTFDPSHQVGLVMFPFAMHFMTARSATNLTDPALGARATQDTSTLPSGGGVFGAQYLNPTLLLRPTPDFDLKFGLLVAFATSSVVDPYRTLLDGSSHNYQGGSADRRDLGLEIDHGFEWRVPLGVPRGGAPGSLTLQWGYQGGVFFPGHAFESAAGARMKPQTVLQARFGGQF